MKITQFHRPNGRKTEEQVTVAADVEALAANLAEVGVRFEVEDLMTGEWSLEACGPEDDDGDVISWAYETIPVAHDTFRAAGGGRISPLVDVAEVREALDRMVRETVAAVAAARDSEDA